jgi:hypothetical protein
MIKENILATHGGQLIGKWNLSIKSFRSTLGQIPGLQGQLPAERVLWAMNMNDNVFVLLEDQMAPNRGDYMATSPGGVNKLYDLHFPGHYRTTFLTLTPPGSFEQLLSQLRARWVPVRQAGSHQAVIDGLVFAIAPDWIVRVGNVLVAGNTVRGMLLEVCLASCTIRYLADVCI